MKESKLKNYSNEELLVESVRRGQTTIKNCRDEELFAELVRRGQITNNEAQLCLRTKTIPIEIIERIENLFGIKFYRTGQPSNDPSK